MKKINWTETSAWAEVIEQGEREDVVLMRDGRAFALLTPFCDEDLDWYERERAPAFLTSIETARRQVREGKTLSHDELKRELHRGLSGTRLTLEDVLEFLERYHQRATYGAVAGVVGGSPMSLMTGAPRSPRRSWVVNGETKQPTGYRPEEIHPALKERSHVIMSSEQLREWLSSPR